MTKLVKRFISLALVTVILMSSLPFSAAADKSYGVDDLFMEAEYDEDSDAFQIAAEEEMKAKAGQGVVEIESLREESSKHFQQEDGAYQAIAYTMAVHRKDAEGKWQDIDNRLFIDPENPSYYTTADERFTFAAESASNILYAINDGAYAINIGLLFGEADPSAAIIQNHPDRLKEAQSLEGEEKLQALINVDTTTKVTYCSVLENMDIEYVITGNDIKENLVLSAPIETENLAFKMCLEGLSAELTENGYIGLVNAYGEMIYCIAAPYMYDAAGEESYAVSYSLRQCGEEYSLQLIVDEDWINDDSRVYPITIDPSITDTQTVSTDTYISSGNPGSNYGSNTNMLISSDTIAYLRATMPTLPTYARITQAQLMAKFYSSSTSGSMLIELYRCVRSWDESTLTWNVAYQWTNRGLASARSSSATATATSDISSSNPASISFGITNLVSKWYAGTSNLGVGLKYGSGALSSVRIFSHEASSSKRPYFSITYVTITNPVVKNGTYFFKNRKTEKYVDIVGYVVEDGIYTQQWSFIESEKQKWKIKYTHYGYYYTISPVGSTSLFLRVKDDSSNANVRIVLSDGTNSNGTRTMTDGMLWSIFETSNNAYKIKAITGESDNRVLAVGSDNQNNNGAYIQQRNYTDNSDYVDEWFIVRSNNSVELEAQKQTNWCWAASARMSSKIYMKSPVSQESAAVYAILNIKTETPTATQISNANITGTILHVSKALNYILGSSNVYSEHHKIYTEPTLISMLNNSNPVIVLRGKYDNNYNRYGGHYTVIYDYYWDSEHSIYMFNIYDPEPINTGSSYSASYQAICNGRSPAFQDDLNDPCIWEDIVVYTRGPYLNTVDWPSP